MRADDMINAFDRVALFRAQASDSYRRVDDIARDLDAAISLLDLQQQSPDHRDEGTSAAGITQGIHRAVLDWSTGIIAKLAGGLLPRSDTKTDSPAAAATVSDNISERHARNTRRWLLDPRTWKAFVLSLEGAVELAEPSTHVPQSAGLAVLRAAVFTVCEVESGESNGGGGGRGNDSADLAEAAAGDWAFAAIRALCSGDYIDRPGNGKNISAGRVDVASDGALSHPVGAAGAERGGVAALDSTVDNGRGRGEKKGGWKRVRGRIRGPLVRMTLDACMTLVVEEVICGRDWKAADFGGWKHGNGGAGTTAIEPRGTTRLEEALTELLDFQRALQEQQTNRRKVFASFCSKLMGPLFRVLSETRSAPLAAAAKALAWDALFHEEHLDGYREAFIAAEASPAAAAVSLVGGEGVGGNKKKKRRKSGKGDDGEQVFANTAAATGGSGRSSQRRASYQQQVLEEMSRLASLVGEERSRLGAVVGAPLLLEGFILGLNRAIQEGADIHVPSGGSGGGSANAFAVMSGKRSRSTANTSLLSGGVSASTSPASQMFKLWSVLTSTLDGSCSSGSIRSVASSSSSSGVDPSSIPPPGKNSNLCGCYLRACNAMLRLLVAHDVYRVNEDRGGVELDRLRAFSRGILHLASGSLGGTAGHWQVEVEVEFVQIFRSLLMLNHEILHDDSSTVLQMAFEWGAAEKAVTEKVMTEEKVAAASAAQKSPPAATSTASASPQSSREEKEREGGIEHAGLGELRTLSADLVVGLVDTYGRLRQMDHLVRSLFAAVAAQPSAAAAVLKGGVCVEEALRRAFRQLPEGQIEPMWCMFADHLRETWELSLEGGGAAVCGGGNLLAREVEAELFVLFVRNLHVTNSVASVVGNLCTSLAGESLRCFERSIQNAMAAVAASPSKQEQWHRQQKKSYKGTKRKEGQNNEERGTSDSNASSNDGSGSGSSESSSAVREVLPFRPALEVYGWLLDLDTRCRFWSQILGSSSLSSITAPLLDSASASTSASAFKLPRMIAAADTTADATGTNATVAGEDRPCAGDAEHEDRERVNLLRLRLRLRLRLKKTLQQVAVHRVQQIYARLNGAVVLETAGKEKTHRKKQGLVENREKTVGTQNETQNGEESPGDEQRGLEREARELVALAFSVARSSAACRSAGAEAAWSGGDDDWGGDLDVGGGGGGGGEGPSLSAMAPYLPVWVGFASGEEVWYFLEAFLSRCASDLLAGRGHKDKESTPLELLTDQSFYETEAVAKIAPAVILCRVRDAIELALVAVGARVRNKSSGGSSRRERRGSRVEVDDSDAAAVAASTTTMPSIKTVLESILALASRVQCLGSTPNDKDDYDDNGKNPDDEKDSGIGISSGSSNSACGDAVTTRVGSKDVVSETLMCNRLREAKCLLLLAEQFPTGFLDDEAVFGLLVAVDALDSTCVYILSRPLARIEEEQDAATAARLVGEWGSGRRSNKDSCPIVALALVETVAALRRLLLVLLVRIRRESSVMLLLRSPPGSPPLKRDRFSPGEALLRAIDPLMFTVSRTVDATGGEGSKDGIAALLLLQLLRSSSALLPVLSELCVAEGQTEVVFEAVARLGVPWAGHATAGDKAGLLHPQQRQQTQESAPEPCLNSQGEDERYEREKRLLLLHGVLSGFVAGETRCLQDSAAAASPATTVTPMVTKNAAGSDGDEEGDEQEVLQTVASCKTAATVTTRQTLELPPLEHHRLLATVSRIAGCLPTSTSAAATLAAKPQMPSLHPLSPSHLIFLGDALRLSFLGPNAERVVFAVPSAKTMPRYGMEARTRSQWVEDAVRYLRYRAMVAVADADAVTGESTVAVSAVEGSGKREGWGVRDGQGRERNKSRGIPRRKRVMATRVGSGRVGSNASFGAHGVCEAVSERSASCQLLRAVCGCSHLLDPPLPRSVIRSLVEAFLFLFFVNGKQSEYSGGSYDRDETEKETLLLETAFCLLVQQASEEQLDEIFATLLGALVTKTTTAAVVAEDDDKDDCDGRLSRVCSTAHACPTCVENVAVTLARLAARAAAGNSEVFQTVASNRALALSAGLCRSLRRTMAVTAADAAHCACFRSGGRLRSAAEALDGLESLLSRGRSVSATARVVSFVLGSIEPAIRAALDAAEALRFGSASGGRFPGGVGKNNTDYDGCGGGDGDLFLRREEIARCFRAYCRVLKTLLQVHARKVFSCAAPFAALCRSLLHLFFCLASAAPPEPRMGGVRSVNDAPPAVLLLSPEEQVSAAKALSRVLEEFLPNGDVLRRYAAFLLLDYVSLAGSSTLEPAPRIALVAGVFAVMEACTRREMRQLHGLLAASSSVDQEVFRSLNEEYQRRHKFTGNI